MDYPFAIAWSFIAGIICTGIWLSLRLIHFKGRIRPQHHPRKATSHPYQSAPRGNPTPKPSKNRPQKSPTHKPLYPPELNLQIRKLSDEWHTAEAQEKERPDNQEMDSANLAIYKAWRSDRYYNVDGNNEPPNRSTRSCSLCNDSKSIIRGHDGKKISCPSCRPL